MDQEPITRAKIDELLRFLPLFEKPGAKFVERWVGLERTKGRPAQVPYPKYTDDVLAFFKLAGQGCWSDYGYKPAEASKMLADEKSIARATLPEIKSMLTFCVRGERFGDGLWEHVLESGRITAILRRLAVLRDSLSESV